jgi:DNA-binding transcriptional MerR regulator
MRYTVNKLAKLSGVSPRTLRFYDKIDLLKPAFYGDNNYRYYEEEQLLMLQQILFFRELGFSLDDIQRILSSTDFDKIKSLKTHKSMLQADLERTEILIKTIDKTILHLEGKVSMSVEEFFDPIKLRDSKIQKDYEKYLVGRGIISQEEMDQSWEKIKYWEQSDWDNFKTEGNMYYKDMVEVMLNGLSPDSLEVQELVHKQYLLITPLWTFNKASYIKLAESYREDANFRKFCEIFHPKLLEFLVESMWVYAQHKLS